MRYDLDTIRPRITLSLMLLAMVATGTFDLVLDWPTHPSVLHLSVETTYLAICLSSAVYLGVGWIRSLRLARALRAQSHRVEAERDVWRERARELLTGLGEAIDAQFDRWGLTRAERETAIYLLKGFSHKEIASITDRSERTVRQHAVAVYRKSSLAGRAELAAFFLQDLFLPAHERDAMTRDDTRPSDDAARREPA